MHSNEMPNDKRLATMNRMLESLTFEEARRLRRRFALTDKKSQLLEELGLDLANLSPAEIRELERQSFLRLKHPF